MRASRRLAPRPTLLIAALLTPAAALGLLAPPASAATFVVLNRDDPGEGFNDPTAVVPLPTNPGTTRGAQRLNVLQAALETWGERLASDVVIRVEAAMEALDCDGVSGVLGGAFPFDFIRDFPGAPKGLTWYPFALADSLSGTDLAPGEPDIVSVFNSAVDDDPGCFSGITWWYGIGEQSEAPDDTLAFFPVVLHELAHGLGFTSLVDEVTGQRPQGLDDVFSVHLEDHSSGLLWSQMSDGQRATSAADSGDLHWVGENVVEGSGILLQGGHPSGHVQIYAPDPPEPGSSVSHWDTDLVPDELMEPFSTETTDDTLTVHLLRDLGYRLRGEEPAAVPCSPDAHTLCLDHRSGDRRFRATVEFETTQGGGSSGRGRAVPLASLGVGRGGLFWFFSADNPEMLLKVIDGCSVNGHFWVFYSAGTNVGLTTTVEDTRTGRIFVETNPDLEPAPPVQDVRAFPCEGEPEEGQIPPSRSGQPG